MTVDGRSGVAVAAWAIAAWLSAATGCATGDGTVSGVGGNHQDAVAGNDQDAASRPAVSDGSESGSPNADFPNADSGHSEVIAADSAPSGDLDATDTGPSGLPSACTGVCNAVTPSNPRRTETGLLGNVTMYTIQASNGGACQYGATQVMYFAAINVNLALNDGQGQWQNGRICGQCVEVTALTTQGPKTVVVRIMDRCADEYCGVDLGGSAPAAVMADGFGRYEGAWRLVSCAGHPEVFDGVSSLFVKDGSNPYWAAIQVRNPNTAVVDVEWRRQDQPSQTGSLAYGSPSIENYYMVPTEVLQGQGTYELTVHYADGSTAKATLSSEQLSHAGGEYPLSE